MKTLIKVTNRNSRKSQILNAEEVNNFFRYLGNGKYQNYIKDYAFSIYRPKKKYDTFTMVLITGFLAISLLLLITKIIQDINLI
tara:strand:- start:419 stop:670 length:252 start_codon:yes stop_codon:yes gene_type:complete